MNVHTKWNRYDCCAGQIQRHTHTHTCAHKRIQIMRNIKHKHFYVRRIKIRYPMSMKWKILDCISLAICFNVCLLKLYIKMNRFMKKGKYNSRRFSIILSERLFFFCSPQLIYSFQFIHIFCCLFLSFCIQRMD